jgi:uncharacterized phage protein (TIGR01671 family)
MREILFRGKRVENGEWVEGFVRQYKAETKYFIEESIEGRDWKVIPETVGQYTGLCDKNGKKIFEGDIVRDCDGRIYDIKYFDFEWIAEQPKSFWINIKHLKPCEIIGNIHDNPELLEVEK